MSGPQFNPNTGQWEFPGLGPSQPVPMRTMHPAGIQQGPPQPPHGGTSGPLPPMPNFPQSQPQPQRGRRWPWVMGMVGTFVLGVMFGAIPGPSEPVNVASENTAPLAGSPFAVESVQGPFKLEVSSKLGRELMVTYTTPSGGMNQDNNSKGTWTKDIPTATEYGSGQVSVSTSAPYSMSSGQDTKEDTVTCRITDSTGKVVQEQTGSGQYASASCIGY